MNESKIIKTLSKPLPFPRKAVTLEHHEKWPPQNDAMQKAMEDILGVMFGCTIQNQV
jgi:hypothetical protein